MAAHLSTSIHTLSHVVSGALVLVVAATAWGQPMKPTRALGLLADTYNAVESGNAPSSVLLTHAVFEASIQNDGRLTTTGTLTETEKGKFAYEPEPSDSLRVRFADGDTFDLLIQKFDGNPTEGLQRFLRSDHTLEYQFRSTRARGRPEVACRVAATREGARRRVAIKGQMTVESTKLTVDLVKEEQDLFDIDPGIGHHHRESLAGTVTAPGLALEGQETLDYLLVNTVQRSKRTLDASWTERGVTYRLSNGRIHKVFRDGWPVEAEFWLAEGTLTRDGMPIGALRFAKDGQTWTISLVQDGERAVLEQHQRH